MLTRITILAASMDYIDHATENEGMPKPVVREQLRKLKHFDTFLLEQMKLDNPAAADIDQSIIQSFFNYLFNGCNAKPATIREYLEVLWSVYADLHERNLIDDKLLLFIHQILTSEALGPV